MKVEGVTRVQRTLDKVRRQHADEAKVSVVVGYTQNYAIYVHEINAKHEKVGQWKYLETPARLLANDGTLAGLVENMVKSGESLRDGLVVAGLRIQRVSQDEYCPVDTTALKASAFTATDEEADAAAASARALSDAIRTEKLLERRVEKARKALRGAGEAKYKAWKTGQREARKPARKY